MPTAPWQSDDGDRNDHAGDAQHRQGPPGGSAIESQAIGQVLVHPLLHLMNELEETPRRQRDEHTDDGSQDEQASIVAGPYQRSRVGWHCRWFSHT